MNRWVGCAIGFLVGAAVAFWQGLSNPDISPYLVAGIGLAITFAGYVIGLVLEDAL